MEQYIKESPLNYQKTNGITNKIKDNIVYGDILTDKHIGSVYNMTESFFQPQAESGVRFIENIKSQWYANERNSLFRDYINETDEERKKEILDEIKDVEYNLRTYVGTGDWVDKISQTAISFGYSMAPALAVGAAATAGVATAGAPLAIAGAVGTTAQALTSYINAFRPERNAIVYETALEHPELSKEEIEKRATTGASFSAGIEAVGSVVGVAGGIKNFIAKKTWTQLTKEIFKQTTKKSLASKALRFGFEAGVEGATEAIQESIAGKAKETSDVKEIALGSVKEISGILEKQAKGLALNEKEEQLIETFVLSTIGSAIVGGGFQSSYTGVEKVWQYQQNKRLQNNFETLRKNIPTDVPEKAQQYVAKEMVNYGKAPENVYMPAEKTLAIVEEQLNKDTLTDVERGRLDALKEKLIQTADKGTGVEQLSFLEVFDTFVNQSDEEFFQKAKSLFFAEESMVDENFSAENLVMQAVKDIMPEAVEADSAFNFAFESLKNANPETIEQETIANALQFQALMNVASTSQGKTFKDIMQENNIVFDIQKKLLSKNEIAGVPYKQETIEDLDTLVYEQGDLFDNLSQIVIDENNKVLSGASAVEKAKKEKAFVDVFRIKAKDFPKIQVQAQEKIAGSVKNTANSIILKMTQTANPTTFAHESFHLFDVLMADAYKNNRLNDYWKKQYERMYKAVGVKDLNEFLTRKIEDFNLNQTAFAGSRVDYDQPSLEAIGSGEGAQAHGWGLYYALNKKIAESYRKWFLQRLDYYKSDFYYNGININDFNEYKRYVFEELKRAYINGHDLKKELSKLKRFLKKRISDAKKDFEEFKNSESNRELLKSVYEKSEKELEEKLLNEIKEAEESRNFLDTFDASKFKHGEGQVHEVDIPENPYLLDEDLTFEEQSDFVKSKLTEIVNSMETSIDLTKLKEITGDKNNGSDVSFETYYAKWAWRTGKQEAIRQIKENNHSEEVEQRLVEFINNIDLESFTRRRSFKGYIGAEIYRELSNYTRSDKTASQLLEKHGIKGITYDGNRDGRCFVIFNPKDVKVIQKFYQGVPSADKYTDTRERLAEAWTEYLATGKEPAQRLFAMFAYFKSMLGTIYHSFVRRNALNKDLRKVYDRIFLSQSEAELAMRALRIGAMKKPANISDEDYAKYIAAAKKTTARISDSINKAIIERTEIENSEEYKTQRESVRADVVKELSDVELFKAQDFILDKKGIQGEFAGIEINPAFKPKKEKALTVEEMAIELTGYLNRQIDASEVMGIISEKTRQETIEQETDLRMQEWLREEYPDLFERMNAFNNALSLKAIDAVTWEYIFASGLKGKSFGEVKALLFKSFSDTVRKESIKNLYNVSDAKKMLQGNIARQKNLKETSAEFIRLKKQQAVTLMRIDLAEVLSKKVASFQRLATRYKQKHFKDEAKYIDADSYELIQAILNEFGFNCHGISDNTKTIEQRFDEWYKQIAPYNKKGVYDFIDKIYASLYGHDTNFKNITLEQFDALNNLIRAIDDTAKKIQSDKNEVKSEEFKGIIASIKERFDFHNVKEKWAFQLKSLNYVVVMPILLRKVLGDDLYVKHFAPFTSALTKAENWRIDKMKKFAEILKDELPRFSDQLAFDILGKQRYFTRETALMMMLNSGNRHNRACIEKYLARILDISEDTEISMEDVFSSILSQMPDEFQDYTQAIWDEIDSSREQFFNSQKEAYGINPTIVEKDQLDFVGSRLKGGYFPSYRSKLKETNDYMETQAYYDKSSFPIATSAHEKIEVHDDLDLSVKILSNWARFTGNSIFISKPYNDVAKILNNSEIKDSLGSNGSKHVSNWLEKANTEEAVFEGMAILDKIANVQILGLTPVKGFKQLSGLAYSINEVGAMNIAGSMLDYFSNKESLNTIKYAMSLSDYMRSRYENAKDHLFAGFSEDALKGNKIKKTLDVANEYGLFFQKYFDAFASSVTWKAVYTREIANGKSEKDAVLLADTIVAQTQGDASKAMRPQALTGVHRLFSKFSTFYISLFNSLWADWTTRKNPEAIAHLAGTVFVTLVGGALFTSLVDSIVGKVFDDDDDKDFDEIFKEEIVRSTASAGVPIWGLSNLGSSWFLYGKVYPNELTFLKPLANILRDLNKDDVVGATTNLLPIPKWISDYIKGED